MLDVPIECLRAQIGAYPLRIAQQRQTSATTAATAVAYHKRMGDETKSVGLKRTAQSGQDGIEIAAGLNMGNGVGQ